MSDSICVIFLICRIRELIYSQTWGGVIGSLGLEEDGADFYASYYTDHVR